MRHRINYPNGTEPFSPKKYKAKVKKKRREMFAAIIALAIVAVFSIIFSDKLQNLTAKLNLESVYVQSQRYPLTIYFPDIGNAGGAVVRTEKSVAIIDCGHEKSQTDISDILKNIGTEKIDIAFLTHPDSDHIGNFSEIIDTFPTDRFVTCEFSKTSDSALYGKLKSTLADNNIKTEYTHTGDEFELDGMTFEIISPNTIYKKSNDNSLVIRLRCDNFTALFTGDISKKAEKDILESGADISADLLCVAHHGSSSSSSEEFLKAVQAKYAVISAQESEYHPSGEAIHRLAENGCEIYRTDFGNGIAVFYDENGIVVRNINGS